MKLSHVAVCCTLVVALKLSASLGAEVRPAEAPDLWQIPQTPVSPRDTAWGPAAVDPAPTTVETPRVGGNFGLSRWFPQTASSGSFTGGSSNVPTPPAAAAANKSPQPTLSLRFAQWRLARIEKVRGQLLKQTSGVSPAETGGKTEAVAQSAMPVRSNAVEALQPPQVEYGPAPETSVPVPSAAPDAAPQSPAPSHEVNIDLPDETEGPKPKGSLSGRLRGGR